MAEPQQDLFFAMAFSPSHYAPPDAPAVVFTLSGLKNCYVVEADGRPAAGATTQIINMPPKCVNVPLYYLFAPRLWHQTASSILSSSGYFLPGTAPRSQTLLRHLCDLLPAHVNDAYSRGYTRVDVAIDVRMWIPVVRRVRRSLVVPFVRAPAAFHPAVPSSAREESDQEARRGLQHEGSEMTMMKLKELGEIESGETCPICFDEFNESKKAVTETPCAHLFHSDCLLPWLLSATSCPLCRSTLQS